MTGTTVSGYTEILEISWEQWHKNVSLATGCVELPRNGMPTDFKAHVRGVKYSNSFVATISAREHKFTRSCHRLVQDGVDMVFVQTYDWTNGCNTTSGNQTFPLQANTLIIQDMAEPFSVEHASYQQVTLALPRYLLKPFLKEDRTYPFLTLDQADPVGSSVVNMLRLLRDKCPSLDEREAGLMIECVAGLTAGVLNRLLHSTVDFNSQDLYLARQFQALDVIRHRFQEPDFSSTQLAEQLSLSRSTVYRLLEPLGGFQECVRDQRMRHAIRLIRSSGGEAIAASELAEQCGYAHTSSFTRFFKEHFGVTPRSAFAGLAYLRDENKFTTGGFYSNWVDTLRRA